MIRKRCRHGKGLTGPAARRAWRACRCAWGVDLNVDGRRVWHNLGPDEHAARVRELRLRADITEGRRPPRARGTGLRDQAADWIAVKTAAGAKVGSLLAYRGRVGHLTDYLGDLPVTDLRLDVVRRMVADLQTAGLAPATVNGVLAALGAVLRHARVVNDIPVERLDLRGVRLPTRPRTDHLTVAECRLVIREAPRPWSGMMEVALLTGLRQGELLALTTGDLDTGRPLVHVRGTLNQHGEVNTPKTRSGARVVMLTPRAHQVLQARAQTVGDGRLWPYRLGDAGKALRQVLAATGLYRPGRGWHSFRHAHAALLNEAGVPLRDAAARLGHGANMAQSLAYGWAAEHLDVAALDEAVTRHAPAPESPRE